MTPAPVLPDLTARTVVVTGANAGLGRFCVEQLAAAGARVVLACRHEGRADTAVASVRARVPAARLDVVRLDLADLDSVRSAAEMLRTDLDGIDAVVCNAGLTGTDGRRRTTDGFELIFGGNHLGHFAFVARLMPALRPDARVVSVGSVAHRWSPLDVSDLQAERKFNSFRQYGRSKTAVMMFAFELDRRCRAAGVAVTGLAAHPGFSLDSRTPERAGIPPVSGVARALGGLTGPVCQGKDAGAWPLAHAAVAADVRGGQYWGPGGWQELTGVPRLSRARDHTRNQDTATTLWTESERLTGPFPVTP